MKTTEPTALYVLSMTPSEARRAQEALPKQNIASEPAQAAVIMETQDDAYWNMPASQIHNIVEQVNERLEDTGESPKVPEPEALEETLEALSLASRQLSWRKWRVDYDAWKDRFPSWEEATKQYPALFSHVDTEGRADQPRQLSS